MADVTAVACLAHGVQVGIGGHVTVAVFAQIPLRSRQTHGGVGCLGATAEDAGHPEAYEKENSFHCRCFQQSLQRP